MGMVVISVKPGLLRLASLYFLNSGIALALTWAFATSDAERSLRQTGLFRLQEAFSGSRRALAFATKRQ